MSEPPERRPEVRLQKELAATPEEVFDAWTDPESLRRWMCPGDGIVAHLEAEVRVGGRFRIVMRFDEEEFEHTGQYREVSRPRRLVFTWVSRATREQESLVTVELTPAGDRTLLRLTHELLPDAEAAGKHRDGWGSILERFSQLLKGGN